MLLDVQQIPAAKKSGAARFVLLLCRPHVVCAILVLFLPLALVRIPALGGMTAGLHTKAGVTSALWVYAIACCVSMWCGYRLAERRAAPELEAVRTARSTGSSRTACLLLSLIGLTVLLLSASDNYFTRILGVIQEGASDTAIRYDPDSPMGDQVGGMVRMFGLLPSAALVLFAALGTIDKKYARSKRFVVTGCLLFGVLAVKSMLALSRVELYCGVGTLLAVAAMWMGNRSGGRGRRDLAVLGTIGAAAVVCSILVTRTVEAVRGISTSDRSPMLEYVDLGISNAELALRTCSQHAFGFETFLHPLRYVNRYFGGVIPLPETQASWIWNPAENLLGASLLDAGLLGFLVFVVYGLLFGAVSRKAFTSEPRLHWVYAYWSLLWGLFSVAQVPLIRAPDYWASFGAGFAVAAVLDRLNRKRALQAERYRQEIEIACYMELERAAALEARTIQRRF